MSIVGRRPEGPERRAEPIVSRARKTGSPARSPTLGLGEFGRIRDRAYAAVGFVLTERCTAACRHCALSAGPGGRPAAAPSTVARWVRSVGEAPTTQAIGITGGEPFLERAALDAALGAAHDAGLRTTVFTNACWATSPEAACEALAQLPHIDLLEISADVFHEEFVPLGNVRRAAEAALDAGTGVWFQVAEVEAESFGTRLREVLGPRITGAAEFSEAAILDAGRSLGAPWSDRPPLTAELPTGACKRLGTPLVCPDGSVLACCSEYAYGELCPTALRLGTLEERSLSAMVRDAQSDPLLAALRALGPAYVADVARHSGWHAGRYREGNVCDLCLDLLREAPLADELRRRLAEPEHDGAIVFAAEVRALRAETDPGEAAP